LRKVFVTSIAAALIAVAVACTSGEENPDRIASVPVDTNGVRPAAPAPTPQECQARYASMGFPKVYDVNPANCAAGLCTESFAAFCSQAGRAGVGVTLCTTAMPCMANGSGGTPAPCPCVDTPPPPPPPPPPVDAGMCDGAPTYPPPNNTDTGRRSIGFNVPEPAAGWACGQLFAIPYLGQVLFSPGGGIGFSADSQNTHKDEWSATCKHAVANSSAAGITVNICGLEGQGRFDDKDTKTDYHCLDCDPPPPACGDLACSDYNHTLTRLASVSKTFPIGFGGNPTTCDAAGGGGPSSRWIDWIKRSMNLSVTVGGGWNGDSIDDIRAKGMGTCSDCTPCETHKDKNNVFLTATGRAEMSTPSWGGLSGSAFLSLTGRVGAGREDQTSTCMAACGGFNANALITLRMGISVGAFGFTAGQSIGYTCRWSQSWSTCTNGGADDVSECGWASGTDP